MSAELRSRWAPPVLVVFAAAALGGLTARAGATEPFAGPQHSNISITILDLPVGLRNVGMGATGVTSIERQQTSYYNPATLPWADEAQLSFGYQDIITPISLTDTRLAYGRRLGDASSRDVWRVGVEIGYTSMSFETAERTIFLPQGTGDNLKIHDYYLTTAVAGAWERGGESIAAGVSGKYLKLDNSLDEADSWLLDYGFVAAAKFALGSSMIRPRAGLAVTNLDTGLAFGDSIKYDYNILGETRYGLGLDFEAPPTTTWGRTVAAATVSVDADYVDRERYTSYWALGWELSIVEFLQMRTGYLQYDESSSSTLCLGAGIGWEFGRWIVHADYTHYAPRVGYGYDLDREMFGATLGARF